MTITSVGGYGLPPGAESKAITPETRVLGAKVGLSREFGSSSHFELIEAAQKLLQLGDPTLSARPDNLEHPGQPRTDRLTRMSQVIRCQLLDLAQGQAQRAQPADHPDTPKRVLIEQPVVPRAAPHRIETVA